MFSQVGDRKPFKTPDGHKFTLKSTSLAEQSHAMVPAPSAASVFCDGAIQVERKGEQRALFYELDFTTQWSIKLRDSGEYQGVIRVYNVGQDTKFVLGGDTDTSYMYQLGHARDLPEEILQSILEAGAELFESLCVVTIPKILTEFESKVQ